MGTTGWKAAEETAAKAGAGIFVKLENDKDKVVVAFVGEPYAYEVWWDQDAKKYVSPVPDGKKGSAKFRFNTYVPGEDAIKILECGVQTFKGVLKARDKYGLDKKCFEIERQGKKGDTNTTYSILPDVDIDAAMKAKMDKHALHDLAKAEEGDEGGGDSKKGEFANYGGADAPIDEKVAKAITDRLKVRPRADIDKFLARFGVEKVKAVKAKDRDAALAFLDELEGKKAETAAPKETDPFTD